MEDGGYDVVHAMLPLGGASVYQLRGGTVPAQRDASLRRRWLLGRLLVKLTEPLNRRRREMAAMEAQVVADRRVLLLPVSAMVARELERFYGRTDNVRVVFNGVDVPEPDDPRRADWRQRIRFQLGVGQGDPVFLTVATNFALKGVAETIEVFARWYHRGDPGANPRLVVVGRDSPEGYQRHAGLRDVGRFVVFVPPTGDVFQWYAAADACVLLSWYDPCSRVVLEACRWGIPSITTAYNGASEALTGGAGIVVASPRDKVGLLAAFDAMADPTRRAGMSQACRRVAERLTIDRHVDELLDAYQEAARRR
jgi:UDP-glucose:(heptosyl)LPS alpha-1,3-glucosyltransferase